MIELNDVLVFHERLIEKFGGASGIRSIELLESAISRPYQTFDGKDLYPEPADKAAAILESIVKNHPFIDGNKRTGYVLMRLMLMQEGLDIDAGENEKYEFVIRVASGKAELKEIKLWIQHRLISK
ncbi:MAG: Fic family protein [Bacteroidota bacterium]